MIMKDMKGKRYSRRGVGGMKFGKLENRNINDKIIKVITDFFAN